MDTQLIRTLPPTLESEAARYPAVHPAAVKAIPPSQSGSLSSTIAEALPLGLDGVQNISIMPRPERHVVALGTTPNIGSEKFLILRHRLVLMRQRRRLKTLVVTSSVPMEGKTVVSVNLAVTLARTFSRVLLVEADMRRPSVQATLGLPSALPGLSEYLEGKLELTSTIRRTVPGGLYVIPAGKPSINPVGLLQSPRMVELISRASVTFDWVIFDTPPVNPFADSPCLASMSDGVLVVARSGVTHSDSMQQMLNALEGTFIAGVILNGVEDPRGDGYYAYYYRAKAEPKRTSTGLRRYLPIGKKEISNG